MQGNISNMHNGVVEQTHIALTLADKQTSRQEINAYFNLQHVVNCLFDQHVHFDALTGWTSLQYPLNNILLN